MWDRASRRRRDFSASGPLSTSVTWTVLLNRVQPGPDSTACAGTPNSVRRARQTASEPYPTQSTNSLRPKAR